MEEQIVSEQVTDQVTEEDLKKIFQTEENIYLLDNNYIQSKLKVKRFESEDPLYPDVLYKIGYNIYEKDATDEDDPIASLDANFEWVMDRKSPRYLDLFYSRDNFTCPLIHCYIASLFVIREFRGQGYGTLLLEHLEECMIKVSKKFNALTLYMGVTDVSKFSETADSIYVKMGFEYKSEVSRSSLKKIIEFENGERMITWKITESEMNTINEALDLLKEKREGMKEGTKDLMKEKSSKRRRCSKSCQTE